MKKRKKNHSKLWAIGILAILLLVTPTLHAYDVWGTENIDFALTETLSIKPGGTANFRTGASASYIYVLNEGTLNMYSGSVNGFISVSPEDEATSMAAGMTTVFGTEFAVSNGTIDPDGNWILDGMGMGTLTGKYEDQSDINLWILSDTPIKLVDIENNNNNDELIIDIKPGSDENVINLKSKGVVPVAVLTTTEFNADTLVPDYSISFAGASPVRSTLCDVDGDDDMDMLFHFRTQELIKSVDNPEGLDKTSTKATLTATLNIEVTKNNAVADGDVAKIEGSDKVKIKSSGKK